MKIDSIFAENLFAFHYENEAENEYERLMNLWTDVEFLYSFAKNNQIPDIIFFVENILKDAEEIQDILEKISTNDEPLGYYFEPLKLSENYRILSLQKGKRPGRRLWLYAIKIDTNCFVITGGAIKMSQKMKEHSHTATELEKLEWARNFLIEKGVVNEDSFYELLREDDYE